ncbi:MAG: CDP-glycerol glycerophosphotransferase family protein, partial [Selenomonadaceae bacterium]|nr:CDP-glycerol glycerophosphotransferase family protein [Selenomonadaceae bacterium]
LKMIRPDAKKIIWATHHSIEANLRVSYATFQWNYKFMYEFAKSHPETSWVVKPHPNLFFKVIKEKVFPSVAAFDKYLKAWDDLPNAQVCTGAYYQSIFATSDGMVHDSASFIAEYQYVNKPMIYLTRETQTYNELGEEILNASYLVDGRDLNAIAAMIQKVIIEGDDYKAAERKAVFDKSLNYPEANGMLASEFIYKNIADEFKEESK